MSLLTWIIYPVNMELFNMDYFTKKDNYIHFHSIISLPLFYLKNFV